MNNSDHIALYRKYRPKVFAEVLGQDHIVTALEKSIANAKVSHAYLFSGGRGTGKTTIARLFAQTLGVHEEDVYEMDAASNRGIDDIRQLREAVRTLPFTSKYKVYILDEVHMLTKDSWGALLKTLEEPPKHVIFILATTDVDKVPDTIISRCEVYTFHQPTEHMLAEHMHTIAKKEKVKLDSGVAELIALAGDHSYRDAIGIFQKLITSSRDTTISIQEAEEIIGIPSAKLVRALCSALRDNDISGALAVTYDIEKNGDDIQIFLKRFLHVFRTILFLRYAKGAVLPFDISKEDVDFARELAEKKGSVFTSTSLVLLIEAYQNTSNSPVPILPLEIALMEILKEEE
ncbi:MAG: DNA polymerase III subunit gamma/tau [Candidatus Pacebacteria bacterium]|nr:DNA polymerase III subunit gamma/tau [Candidatus Paceibacterota bacterium]